MPIIKLKNLNLVLDTPYTFLTSDTASGVSTLTVKNISGFAINQVLIIGDLGNQNAEIVKTHASTAPTGTTITLAAATVNAHSSSTPVRLIQYDQVEFSTATTTTGSKSVLATNSITADSDSSNYIDNAGSTGYYFGRFKNTISSTFSSYSDPIPVAGFGVLSARAVIDSALGAINKKTSETLSDSFAFGEIDNCQTEVIRELKRWSWLQKFDSIIGQLTTGSWKVAVPTDLDDQNTNKSIYTLRIGTNGRLTWVDKEKFDEFMDGVSYSTLTVALTAGATTLTLSDSSDFSSTGTVVIGANSYTYTANNTTTNVLTLSTTITSSNTAASGADVFQGATSGLPQYWTTYGGYIYYYPITASTYNGKNIYANYYTAQVRITTDSTNLVIPDPTIAINYLCWKFLRKLNNGKDDDASLVYKNDYLARREKLKQKETLGRTFKFHPRVQNFSIETQFNEGDTRSIRVGNFPNTGL